MVDSCIYSLRDCATKMTREHVISKSALKVVFGPDIRNVVSSDLFPDGHLYDHEPLVRNVCHRCNEQLSNLGIDDAGARLISQVMPFYDPSGKTIEFTNLTLRWLLKTHLNYLGIIKSSETGQPYPFPFALKKAIIYNKPLRHDRFALYLQGWQGQADSWAPPSARLLTFFSYRSVEFREQRMLLCDLRVKNVCFILLLPADGQYTAFESRVRSVIDECRVDIGLDVSRLRTADLSGTLRIEPVVPWSTVETFLGRKVELPPLGRK